MENQLNEAKLIEKAAPAFEKMKLTCKYIEYRLLKGEKIDFGTLDKLFENQSHFQNLFNVADLRYKLFLKNLEHLEPSLSLPSKGMGWVNGRYYQE